VSQIINRLSNGFGILLHFDLNSMEDENFQNDSLVDLKSNDFAAGFL